MTERSNSGRKLGPAEKVDCRILSPSSDGSVSRDMMAIRQMNMQMLSIS